MAAWHGDGSIAAGDPVTTQGAEVIRPEVRSARIIVALLGALKQYAEWMGPACLRNCPADDTCECEARPIHDAIRDAIELADERDARCICDGCPEQIPSWWASGMCYGCVNEDCEHEEAE